MSIPVGVRNDRDAVIAVVAEHYLNDDIRQAEIKKASNVKDLTRFEHGAWIFWYNEKENVIYL